MHPFEQDCKKITLQEARHARGLTRKGLAELSSVSPTSIKRIEAGGTDFKTNYATAVALATALNMHVDEIYWPRGLSHLGRPGQTASPVRKSSRKRVVRMHRELRADGSVVETTTIEYFSMDSWTTGFCSQHRMQLSVTGLCCLCE